MRGSGVRVPYSAHIYVYNYIMNKGMKSFKILFVCLGNICRSPMAETIMNALVCKQKDFVNVVSDSAGISSYHMGENSDMRMRTHASRHGYKLNHISRPVILSDFDEFDFIISMDESVHDALLEKAPTLEQQAKIYRMTDFCVNLFSDHIPDPYYGGEDVFERVIALLEDSCSGLLKHIKKIEL